VNLDFFSNICEFGRNFFKLSKTMLNFKKSSSEISVLTEIFMHFKMENTGGDARSGG
jgi:predicted nucleotide-binding protein (sugar kinase/HSP70/actin superfamily)